MNAQADKKSKWMDIVAGFIAVAATFDVSFIVIAPYFGLTPKAGSDQSMITNNQTMLFTVYVAIASFFYGASKGTRDKDETIQTLSNTASKAQDALAPLPSKSQVEKPADVDQWLWDILTDDQKAAMVAKRAAVDVAVAATA